jgi:hypothetical protein
VRIASILYQWDALDLKLDWLVSKVTHGRWYFLYINALSWFLLAFLVFRFIDLLRHRVPDELETTIHNNSLPNPVYKFWPNDRWNPARVDLRKIGHYEYLIFPSYVAGMCIILFMTTVAIFFVY